MSDGGLAALLAGRGPAPEPEAFLAELVDALGATAADLELEDGSILCIPADATIDKDSAISHDAGDGDQVVRLRIEGADDHELTVRALTAAFVARRRADRACREVIEVQHELRQPLQAMLSAAEFLERTGGSAQAAERVRAAASHCRAVLGGSSHRRESIRVAELVSEAICLAAIDTSVVTVDDRCGPSSTRVLASRTATLQILVNLIVNGEHAVREGDGRGCLTIEVSEPDEGTVAIAIEDDGPGVPEGIRARIFEEAFTTRPRRGTGTGLFLSRRLAREQGGSLDLEDGASGARFLLKLPADIVPEASDALSILVVDDDPEMIETYRLVLSLDGHDVTTETDPRIGLERLFSLRPDVALVDIRMATMPGPEFHARAAAQAPELARRIVFATGDLQSDTTRRFLDSTGNPYLSKPFTREDLVAAFALITLDRS